MQIIPVTMAPHSEIAISTLVTLEENNFVSVYIIRSNPYPPSFSKIAAKIIDPAIGASTCALGSHRCTKNMGSFTKNPIIIISLIYSKYILLVGVTHKYGRLIIECPEEDISMHNKINMGKEAVTVYIIKYILAWTRSGW